MAFQQSTYYAIVISSNIIIIITTTHVHLYIYDILLAELYIAIIVMHLSLE